MEKNVINIESCNEHIVLWYIIHFISQQTHACKQYVFCVPEIMFYLFMFVEAEPLSLKKRSFQHHISDNSIVFTHVSL